MSQQIAARGVIKTVYSTETGMDVLDYTMSDSPESVKQVTGWLQLTDSERDPVVWVQGGHTWWHWKRV